MATTILTVKKLSRKTWAVIVLMLVFVVATVVQDLLEANFNNSSFYLTESLLFTSFWWLFIPFIWMQFIFSEKEYFKSVLSKFILIIVPAVIHAIGFPLLVWLLSALFYENTFRIIQTLRFTLSEYLYVLLIAYTLPLLAFRYYKTKMKSDIMKQHQNFETNFLVTEKSKHISVAAADVSYISANSPYISIHHGQKVYLLNTTLKEIVQQYDPQVFVRIHKSTIVNINYVDGYTSRLNGDYDLTLKDGTELRISRNYVSGFKSAYHRLRAK